MDAVAFGYDRGVIPRMETSTFKGDEKLIQVATDACKVACPDVNVHVGRVLTGDQFISDKTVKNDLISTYDGYCCEMEGAAIAHAAYLNSIPFLIIRAISDKADDSASMDYPTFEAMAIENSVKLMKEMIKAI
jgi:adenosylhomocysteine nucleosidase